MNFKFIYALVILLLLSIPAGADTFTPVIDGQKGLGEYTNANTYQIAFTDPDTNVSETGTVYAGRNSSHYHFALEMGYPAGDAIGSIAFAITYAAKTPSTDQIMDRHIAIYAYNYTENGWKSSGVDQNEQQGTHASINETNDVAGAGSISATKMFLEMSMPFNPTDSEPYDRHLDTGEQVIVVFSALRAFYNTTENLDWGFNALSQPYNLIVDAAAIRVEVPSSSTTSSTPTPIISAVAAIVSLQLIAMQIRKLRIKNH